MNMICPVCGAEYLGWVTRCTDCGVAVVLPTEAPNPLDLPEEEQVIYELGGWSLDLQASAAAAMAEAGIPHAFDGPDLVVHVDHEAAVDALLDAVEHGPDGTGGDGGPSTLVYELDQWDDALRRELCARLDAGGVPYRMEGDQLVVDPADEEAVDFLVAEVRGDATEGPADVVEAFDALDATSPGAAATDGDEDEHDGDEDDDEDEDDEDEDDARPSSGVEGAASAAAEDDEDPEVLGRIYLTAANLADDPGDPEALVELLDFSDTLDENRPPFGVDRGFWEQVLVVVDDLADTIAGPDLDDDDADDEDADEDNGPVGPDDGADQSGGGAIAGSRPARGQFIPQRVERAAPKPTTASAVPMDEAQAKRLARQLRSMLQPYV